MSLNRFRENKIDERFKVVVDKSVRPTLEMAMNTCALGLACVLAGTGDIDALRVFRELRVKIEDVAFGTHQAIGTAIGTYLMFLCFM